MTARTSRAPALSRREFARWAWRQFTSMRVALILLFLLAVAAIPGSIVPQTDINPLLVRAFRARNPGLAEWYDRLGLFDVYSAPWFAAIYLALLVSLVGCILPRTREHWRAVRSQPPPAPRRLSRMPAYRSVELDASPADVLAVAHAELRSRRYRVAPADTSADSVAAEAGHLRETGNLVFHLSVVVVLLTVALGGLFGYRGTVLLPEGSGFANTLIQYDGISSGAFFDPNDLPPFSLDLDEFAMDFNESGPQRGTPSDFEARVRITPAPGEDQQSRTIRVNEPLEIDGSLIHILNPGYAPAITVRDADGNILADGPVPFLPQDGNFMSLGVRKIPIGPDTATGEDIGIQAVFYPTLMVDDQGPRSAFAGARNPALLLTAFKGDLGLDNGLPQSVYRLDTTDMEQVTAPDGEPFRAMLFTGETIELPDGLGSVTFDGYVTWVNLQISRTAGKQAMLAGALAAVAGLVASLYVRRRRVWVRVGTDGSGTTRMEVAGLARTENGDIDTEVGDITDGIRTRLHESTKSRVS